jgi:hypothetical protein
MKSAAIVIAMVVHLSMYVHGLELPSIANHLRAMPLNPQPLPPGIVAKYDHNVARRSAEPVWPPIIVDPPRRPPNVARRNAEAGGDYPLQQ